MKKKTQKKVYNESTPASRHPILRNFFGYYLAGCIFLGTCFWFIPAQQLIPEDAEVAKVAIYHIQMGAEASGIVAQMEQDAEIYEYTAEDEEFPLVMKVLEGQTSHRTFRGLFGSSKLDGKGSLDYYQHIILYDEEGNLLSYMTCNGNGKLLKYRVYRMNKADQRQMMEGLREIYQP